jgi:hypothetical protein
LFEVCQEPAQDHAHIECTCPGSEYAPNTLHTLTHYTLMNIYIHTHTHSHTYIHTIIYTLYIHTCTLTHIPTYTHIHTNTYTHLNTHTYIQTHTHISPTCTTLHKSFLSTHPLYTSPATGLGSQEGAQSGETGLCSPIPFSPGSEPRASSLFQQLSSAQARHS